MHSSKKGFTLAEVLVTLAIIGVVASLTIPTLIQSTNSSRYQTSYKKAISILNQALTTSVAQEGTDASSAATSIALAAIFKPYLNVIQDDGAGNFWLADGSKISFVNAGACAAITDPSTFVAGATQCYAIVDVNGDKAPNAGATATSASDIYIVGIAPNNVVPVGLGAATPAIPDAFAVSIDGTDLSSDSAATGVTLYPATITPGDAALTAIAGSN